MIVSYLHRMAPIFLFRVPSKNNCGKSNLLLTICGKNQKIAQIQKSNHSVSFFSIPVISAVQLISIIKPSTTAPMAAYISQLAQILDLLIKNINTPTPIPAISKIVPMDFTCFNIAFFSISNFFVSWSIFNTSVISLLSNFAGLFEITSNIT